MEHTLRELRKSSDLKANEIAYRMGIQSSTLYSWENGDRLIPINKLISLLELYNYPINDFNFDKLVEQYETKKQVKENV